MTVTPTCNERAWKQPAAKPRARIINATLEQLTTAEVYFPQPESPGGWRKLDPGKGLWLLDARAVRCNAGV